MESPMVEAPTNVEIAPAAIERLSQAFVLADVTDLPALAELHTHLEEVATWTREAGRTKPSAAATAAAALVEKVVLEEAKDPRGSLEIVGAAIGYLQRVLVDGRDDGADYPPGLELPASPGLQRGEGGPAAPAPSPPQSAMLANPELIGDFIAEASEHLDASDQHLLVLEKDPLREEELNGIFRAFHTIKGNAGYLGLGPISMLAHQAENVLDLARKGKLSLEGDVLDAAFQAVDTMKGLIGGLRAAVETGAPIPEAKGLDALLSRLAAIAQGLPASSASPGATVSPAPPVQGGQASPPSVEAPPAGAKAPPAGTGTRSGETAAITVREPVKVDADRMDKLIDAIGELVIAESMVSQAQEVRSSSSAQLARQFGLLDKITRELQELGMSLRMVPLRNTFQKMARLVRDLSKKMGKPVDFIVQGEETELDKAMVDKIGDPLVHMIRNSIDHGLEKTPEDRRKAGKPEVGRIELRAFHKAGKIHIEVSDDGRGLDRERILTKARDRGLLRPGETPGDREIVNLIFLPGLSTAEKITDVSGRGVGLDVVKKSVDALRGQIEVRSEPGKGSTFSLNLPLTLAIIDGMVIRVGNQTPIIPTLSIIRSLRPDREALSTVVGKGELLMVQGQPVPIFRLSRLLRVAGAEEDPTRGVVVLVEDDGRQVGILVDEILGQQQIVIKNLGDALREVPGISGGAILPTGLVGLILDVGGLVRLACRAGGGDAGNDGYPAGGTEQALCCSAAGIKSEEESPR
jgi:two-component system, chemotaxis family, sensor kinase CheA